jgi:hypothetical protein
LSKRPSDITLPVDVAVSSAAARIAEAPKAPRLHVTAVEGQRVWFKHFGAEPTAWGKRLHQLVSPLLHPRFLRATPAATPEGKASRERRKMEAFRAAGFRVAEIFYQRGEILALSDMGETMQSQMRRLKETGAVAAHDELLIRAAEALGQVHRAGLCHGRPHPRDIWLLFFQITIHARCPETPVLAFQAYRASAPRPTLDELARLLRFFRVLIPLGRIAAKFHLGGDLERFMTAMDFFRDAERTPPKRAHG